MQSQRKNRPTSSTDTTTLQALLRGSLRKAFGAFDLLSLGLGIVIASGWTQLSGTAARYAGPALIISYLLSGLASLLAASCYAELCVEFPVSGGSFSYIMVSWLRTAEGLSYSGILSSDTLNPTQLVFPSPTDHLWRAARLYCAGKPAAGVRTGHGGDGAGI